MRASAPKRTDVSRPPAAPAPLRLCFAEFELDEANATLLRHGKALALAPTPFNLLCALARQPGALLTKDTLLDTVWGHQFVTESVLKTAVSDLRTVLELLALVDLGEHGALGAEERRTLEALVHRLPEADDTPPVDQARALLAANAPD